MKPGLRRTLPALATAFLGAATLGVMRVLDPNAAGNPLPPCPIHTLTGIFCPGCGATRALHALAHGDVSSALAMNPLLVVALPLVGLMLLRAMAPDGLLRTLPMPRASHWLWAILVFTVARNLPWAPFEALAPG